MNDLLGARIKRYEQAYKHNLTPRSCLFIRVDGKAFHSFTRGMERPFDQALIDSMVYAAHQTITKQMSGGIAAYVQSDECTFMLCDFMTHDSQGWFDYELNKVVSISASAFTYYFNEKLRELGKVGRGVALFDSRAFIVPYDDAPNIFIWRQRDWQRNSLQMLARSHFSQSQLHGKNAAAMLKLLEGKDVDYHALHEQLQNGTYMFKGFDFKPDYRDHDYDGLRQRIVLSIDQQDE